MERKPITIRSYSRCLRDGIAYALRHFPRLLWVMRYVLPLYVLSFLLFVLAEDALSLRMLAQPGEGHVLWVMFTGMAVGCFVLLDVGLQAVLVAYQKRTYLNKPAEEGQGTASSASVNASYLRILLAMLVRGGLTFAVVLLFLLLAPYLTGFALVAVVVALLALCLLFIVGVTRLFYMKYAYENDGFWTAIRNTYRSRWYLGRTIVVELLSFFVIVGVMIAFGAPFFIMRHVVSLAAVSRLAGEPSSLPAYASVLYYVCIVIFALGLALSSLLVAYPVCMNWQSIKALEEEEGK